MNPALGIWMVCAAALGATPAAAAVKGKPNAAAASAAASSPVPVTGAQDCEVKAGAAKKSRPININTASLQQLRCELDGIPAARLQAIIDNRPYANVVDLQNRGILSRAIFEKIESRLAVAALATPAKPAKPAQPAQPAAAASNAK